MVDNKMKESENILTDRQTDRQSGIEFLKVFAIILIVISHCVNSLIADNLDTNAIFDIKHSSTDIQNIILIIMHHFGVLGNSIFFVCSAWFLLESTSYNKRKWFRMLVEIWTVSVIILVISSFVMKGSISPRLVVRSFFPTLFANNWYMTCYLLFYPIHPILNKIICLMNQKTLFRVAVALAFLYIFMCNIDVEWFFCTPIVLWVAIYFVIAYMKKYMPTFQNDIKANWILFGCSTAILLSAILLTNLIGLHIVYFSMNVFHWVSKNNICIILMSISLLNIVRQAHFVNKAINYISKLSMLVYIIHENIILATYARPKMWSLIYNNCGYKYVLGWVFVVSMVVLAFGFLSALAYKLLLQKKVNKVSDSLYNKLREAYYSIENKSLNFLK